MKKDNEKMPQEACSQKGNQKVQFSDTIKDAHASGDGAMERAKDSLLEPDEDEDIDGTRKPKANENY